MRKQVYEDITTDRVSWLIMCVGEMSPDLLKMTRTDHISGSGIYPHACLWSSI